MYAAPLPTDFTAADPADARAGRRLRMLEELAEIGMDMARALRRQALAQAELQDIGERAGVTEIAGGVVTLSVKGDLGLAFSRVARAVRLTLAMETRRGDDGRPGESRGRARGAAA
jgi:hypothetical protein